MEEKVLASSLPYDFLLVKFQGVVNLYEVLVNFRFVQWVVEEQIKKQVVHHHFPQNEKNLYYLQTQYNDFVVNLVVLYVVLEYH